MSEVRVIEIHENALAGNDRCAENIRRLLKENGTYFMNVMSSPGSGKTTLLCRWIPLLKEKYRIAEMDVDIESSLDARRVSDETGVRSMQIHNGGLCHIDADMTLRAIRQFGTENTDLLILENIGNLVCPAEFDTGAHLNLMLYSVPEGDDKPLKYPLMFSVCDLIVITKIDTLPFFNFDMDKALERIRCCNPKAAVISVSAKTGEGLERLNAELDRRISKFRGGTTDD